MVRPKGSTGRKQLTFEERLRVRTLYNDAKMSPKEIIAITGFSADQVRYAIRKPESTEASKRGRPRAVNAQQEQDLVGFVTLSKENRRMTFSQLSLVLFNGAFGIWAIKNTLYRLGFRRRVAREKPPISEETRLSRLAWAREHINWTAEQWAKVLWAGETWVTGGPDSKTFVTRRIGEEYDPTCVVEKIQRKRGWIFWGCFSSAGKGPGIFWEKDWGPINTKSSQERTVPIIQGWLRLCERDGLVLMQDGAPAYAAKETQDEIQQRGLQVIVWPESSPDLNPIENCWNWMKEYIQDKWGLDDNPGYDKLRVYVMEAWNQLPEEYLARLLASMSARCRAVIDADGMHTPY